MVDCLGEIAQFVGSGPRIKMQLFGLRRRLQPSLEFCLRLVEISGLVLFKARGGRRRRNGQ